MQGNFGLGVVAALHMTLKGLSPSREVNERCNERASAIGIICPTFSVDGSCLYVSLTSGPTCNRKVYKETGAA
jgi:hypothetical protein